MLGVADTVDPALITDCYINNCALDKVLALN